MENVDIKIYDLAFSWGDDFSMKNISLEIKRGECFQVMGDSNAGKSTLLKLCIGLLIPQHGAVLLFGQDLNTISYYEMKEVRKKIGVVFQESTPINNISIFENVALPLRYHTKLKEEEIKEKVDTVLYSLGIEHTKSQRPYKLAHREKIKLDVARALILEPEILFLDAPFLPLDLEDRVVFLEMLQNLKNNNLTIFITGNTKMLLTSLADKVAVLKGGSVVALSTAEDILVSNNSYIRSIVSGEALTYEEEKICNPR